MKNRASLHLLFFGLVYVLLGCSTSSNINVSESEKQFAAKFPIGDMNKSLSLAVDSNKQSFPLGTDIPLTINNRSKYNISFDVTTHIKILRNIDSEWIEIDNAVTYSGIFLLYPQGTPLLDSQYTSVEPIINKDKLISNNEPISLRIVIIGDVMSGDVSTGNKVGAYVDIVINPIQQTSPTAGVIYSADETIPSDKGKIQGVVTSADEIGKPLTNVIVVLKYHPFFSESGQSAAIATTRTDSLGRYTFDGVEPGIYAIQTTVTTNQGKSCDNFDASIFIRVEVGILATVNFSLEC